MSWKIGMPNLGHTMEEGKVSEWLKKVGDPVEEGEVIAVVESDKAAFDVESPATGVMVAIHAAAGDTVAVGATIGLVGNTDEIREVDDKASAPVASAPPAPLRDEQAQPTPVSRSRRAIAEATSHSWRAIPHVPVSMRADVTDLLQARGVPLTAAIARATCLALREHPCFNGWYSDDLFTPSPTVNVSFAVATPQGVVTAVVPAADTLSIADIHAELQRLAKAARSGTLEGARMIGGSFTISSLGKWGVDSFAPIISAPQVAILGVGRVDSVVREADGGGFAVRKELQLTLVFDHRANDGVEAAEFLACVREHLEKPDRLGGVK